MTCEHGRTHKEAVFIDLEDNGNLSYDVYEVCDNCNESWIIDEFEDNGEELARQKKTQTTLPS